MGRGRQTCGSYNDSVEADPDRKDSMYPTDPLDPNQDPESDEPPSKSQKKRDMTALQDLGAALVELPADRLSKLEMPDALRLAITEARRMTKHEARRRQMQYIGKLMRSADAAPLQAAVDSVRGASAAESARLHRLERLRQRLLDDERGALEEIAAAHPGADLQQLRQLRRNTLKEREQDKPPRAYREIFKLLRQLDEK